MRVQYPHSYADQSSIEPLPADAKPLPNPYGNPDNIYYRVPRPEPAKPGYPGLRIEILIKDRHIVQLIYDYNGQDPVVDLEFEIDNYCSKHHVHERVHDLPEVQAVAQRYLKESDKEDIMAGLGELESWVDAPFTPLLEALTKKGYKVTNVEYNFSTNHEEGFIGISLSIPSGLPGMYLMLNGPGVYDDAQGEDPGFDSVTALDIDQTVSVVIDANKINKPSIDVLPPTYFNPVKNIVTYSIEIGEVPSEVKDRVISEMEAIINTIKQHNA
jgi:hypothetical protein